MPYFRGFLHTFITYEKCAEIFNSRTGHHIGTIKKMHTEKSAIYSGFLAFREQKFYSKNRSAIYSYRRKRYYVVPVSLTYGIFVYD